MNRKEYDTPKGKAVFEYDGDGVGRITLECMDMLMDMVASSMWIPCSERLPREYSDEERVLATTDVDGVGVIIMPIYDVKSWYLKGYVSAWMPLPEPWKGADDE